MIPKNITTELINKALGEIDISGIPKGRESKKYSLCYGSKRYPPKYVISLANKYANGYELPPSVFSGGLEVNGFLENRGFSIAGPDSNKDNEVKKRL